MGTLLHGDAKTRGGLQLTAAKKANKKLKNRLDEKILTHLGL